MTATSKERSAAGLFGLFDRTQFVTGVAVALVVLMGSGLVVGFNWNRFVGLINRDVPIWAVVAVFVGGVALARLRTSMRSRPISIWVDRVSYGGIDWDIQCYANSDRHDVKAPICPDDSRALCLLLDAGDGRGEIPVVVTSDESWRKLPSARMRLCCPKCSKIYDLSKLGHSMTWLIDFVQEEANGERRDRVRARTDSRK